MYFAWSLGSGLFLNSLVGDCLLLLSIELSNFLFTKEGLLRVFEGTSSGFVSSFGSVVMGTDFLKTTGENLLMPLEWMLYLL